MGIMGFPVALVIGYLVVRRNDTMVMKYMLLSQLSHRRYLGTKLDK